jgi:PAS domain S-box-containing protein
MAGRDIDEKHRSSQPDQGEAATRPPAPSEPSDPQDPVAAYRRFLESTGDGYFEVNLRGSFTYVNEAACRFAGRSREELMSLNYRAYQTPEQARRSYEIYTEVYRTGRPSPLVEYEVLRKDGTVAVNETIASLIRNAAGEPIGFRGVVRDLTEKKRIERALKESEEKHRYILGHMEEGYYETDLSGNFTDFNAAACRNLGRGSHEMQGLNYRAYMSPETVQKVYEVFNQVYRTGQPAKIECEVFCKDGTRRIHEMSVSLLKNAAGQPMGFFGITRDRTDQLKMEQALKESEESYRQVLELAPDVVTINDARTERFVQVNAAFCQHTGYTPEEVIGRTSLELDIYANPEDYQRLKAIIVRDRRVDGLEISYKDKAGHCFEDLVSARMIRFKGRSCILVVATVIAPLKRAQEALSDSEESYRRIMELAPDMIVITRVADSRIMAVNEAFSARTGFSNEEAVGHTPLELGLYTDPENRRKWMEMLRRDGKVQGLELQFLNRDGTVQDDLFSAQYIRFKGEACILAVITSITSFKQTQRALHESEKSYRTIIESAPNAMSVIQSADNRYVAVNKAFCRQTGYHQEEAIGRTVRELNIYADRSDLVAVDKALSEHGLVEGLEVRFRMKDGSITENLLFVTPIRYRGEACYLATSIDLTAIKEAQRALSENEAHFRYNLEQMVAERTRELEAAQIELVKRERLAVLGQLTATVSHELRNPLGVIRSSNFYLRRKTKEKDEKDIKHFRRIDEQVALCDTIVADLLEYTRGRGVNKVRQALGAWLPQVVEQIHESEGVQIEWHISADLPPVPHDQEKMRRVLINALDNAVQAVRAQEQALKGDSPGYRPHIVVEAEKQEDAVAIRIIDNGIGMDAETCRRAFEPLFTTRARGTGIGLANVKKIVEEHDGHIDLQSTPGQGTRMRILLPCAGIACRK